MADIPNSVRRSLTPVETWPSVDEFALTPTRRAKYLALKEAILMYVANARLADIREKTGIDEDSLIKYAKQTMAPHKDGRVFGFRGLLPYIRVSPQVKTSPQKSGQASRKRGPHLLTGLFQDYPTIKKFLDDEILGKASHKFRTKPIKRDIHRKFVAKCRESGIGFSDYPFNTDQQGYVSVCKYASKLLSSGTPASILAKYGEDGLKRAKTGDGTKRPVLQPYDRVECDAHLIDAIFCILAPTPDGDIIPVVLPRLWLIAIQDVASRAVLGYHLSLNRECTESDLLRAIRSALTPWVPMDDINSPAKYSSGAGLSSVIGEKFTGLGWKEFSADGAKINRSERVVGKLNELMNAQSIWLPRHIPNDRPFIERLFGNYASKFHRLPNSTGSGPWDKWRNTPEAAACKYFIDLKTLTQILDAVIANYNTTPHSSLYAKTPLEFLERWGVNNPAALAQRKVDVSEVHRLTHARAQVRITGGKGGRAIGIHFSNAFYSSPVLARAEALVGETVSIEYDPDDGRHVLAFGRDGQELGPLTAAPPYNLHPHPFFMRSAIEKRRKKRILDENYHVDPIGAHIAEFTSRFQAGKSPSNEFLEIFDYFRNNHEELRSLLVCPADHQELIIDRSDPEPSSSGRAMVDEPNATRAAATVFVSRRAMQGGGGANETAFRYSSAANARLRDLHAAYRDRVRPNNHLD